MDIYIQIEKALKEFLLKYEFVIDEMGASPRSIGDKVQEVITKNFPKICKEVATQLRMEFKDVFVIVNADYQLNLKDQTKPILFEQIIVAPIEHIAWDCLRFGKLGYGQIQVEPGKLIEVNREQTREIWMNTFFQKLISFYEEELKKSRAMVKWAQRCQELWHEGRIQEISRLRTYIIREPQAEYKTSKE